MKAVKRNSSGESSQKRLPYLAVPMSAGCAALILAAAAQVHAEDAATKAADDQPIEEIVVTGIRAAIESAIEVKKDSDAIVEAISAEDIGKLPDTSVAESLSRLPGLAAQRFNGRDQSISIRGMGPDFSTGLLNGREQVSTGDSRAVQYDQYPSELVNAVTVYKTVDGALVGQGLSGTVDIQTVRPLSRDQMAIAANYRREKLGVGTLAEGSGNRYSLSYIDQFFDHKFGIAVGAARLDETGPTTSRFESWGTGTTTYNGATVNVPYNGFNAWADQTTQRRDGLMGVLQFKPNDFIETSLDLFYAKFDSTTATKGFQAPLNDSWNAASGGNYDSAGVLSNATVDGSGNVTSGTFDNVRAVVRNDADHTVDKLNSYGWNTKFHFSDNWSGMTDLAWSRALKTGQHVETTAGTVQDTLGTADLDSVAFTSAGQFTPGFNYTDHDLIKLTDVQGWGGGVASPQAGYVKLPYVKDELTSLRVGATRTLDGGLFSSLETGLNYSNRTKTRSYTEGRLVIAGQGPLGYADIPGSSTTAVDGISIATFDPVAALGSIYSIVPKLNPDIYNKDWTVYEKVATAYAKLRMKGDVFGLPMTGNVGLQIVHTDQSSKAFNVDRGSTVCTSDQVCPAASYSAGTTYWDVLPSLNMVFDLQYEQKLRLSLARQMARPTLSDMRASVNVGADTTNGWYSADAGNPTLKPFRANALDLTYEKYFGRKAYVAVQSFYKDLTTYIIKGVNVTDFTSYVSNPVDGISLTGPLTHPVNGHGGKVQGVELAASLPFDMLWEPLEGFGVQGSFALTDSSVRIPVTGINGDSIAAPVIQLPGLSKHVSNLTVYFERWGFEARLSQTQRSDFVGEVQSFTGDRLLSLIKGEKIIDGQLSYTFNDATLLKGLSLQFQAQNLTNQPFHRYRDAATDIIEYTKYGRTYLLGINYKL